VTFKVDLRKKEIDGVIWILLGQDRVKWRAVVKMVINIRVP
jgi:hypothetical protein